LKYWDSSALVPLLVKQEMTAPLQQLYAEEQRLLTWWGTEVECASAVSRLEREALLSTHSATAALQRLDALARSWHQIEPVDAVRITAKRFLRVHALRAADALQLAAAFLASEARPPTLEFVCLDGRLAAAAQREGFVVIEI
jgi:uncharacterized protein